MTRYSVQPRDNSPKNNSETNEEEILREKYISSEVIIDWWLKIKGRKVLMKVKEDEN